MIVWVHCEKKCQINKPCLEYSQFSLALQLLLSRWRPAFDSAILIEAAPL